MRMKSDEKFFSHNTRRKRRTQRKDVEGERRRRGWQEA